MNHLAGCRGDLGQHRARFLALGEHDSGYGSQFNMTALAMRAAGGINAVSELHGHVTREMWQGMWPDRPVDGVPVQAITNDVHVPTWIAAPMRALLTEDMAADWTARIDDPETWRRFDAISDADLCGIPKAQDMIRRLVEGHETVARTAREIFKTAENAGDQHAVLLGDQRCRCRSRGNLAQACHGHAGGRTAAWQVHRLWSGGLRREAIRLGQPRIR